MVKYLLSEKARTELTTRDGTTKAMDIAENLKNREIMDLLNEHEAKKADETANQNLMTAVRCNDEKEVRKLLDAPDIKQKIQQK